MIITIKSKGSFANQYQEKIHTDVADIIIDVCNNVLTTAIINEIELIRNLTPTFLTVDKIKEIANQKAKLYDTEITIEEQDDVDLNSEEHDENNETKYKRPKAISLCFDNGWPVVKISGMVYGFDENIYDTRLKITPGIISLIDAKTNEYFYKAFEIDVSNFNERTVENAAIVLLLTYYNDTCERNRFWCNFIRSGYVEILKTIQQKTVYTSSQIFSSFANPYNNIGHIKSDFIYPNSLFNDPNSRINKNHF